MSKPEFVPYSTDDRGYPHMIVDEWGRGKLICLMPTTATQSIYPHGLDAPKDEEFPGSSDVVELRNMIHELENLCNIIYNASDGLEQKWKNELWLKRQETHKILYGS